VTQEGINKWSLLIFGGGAAGLWAWSLIAPRLGGTAQQRVRMTLYALPFVAMSLLAALALWIFVLPQLA
jgi:hypothetical protein